MQNIIQMELLSSTSDSGFSLDELVIKVKKLLETRGAAGVLEIILTLIEEHVGMRLIRNQDGGWFEPCCSEPSIEWKDRRSRQIRTSVGVIKMQWRRMRCRCCGRSFTLLQRYLGLDAQQSKTNELEQTVVEIVSEQSYRRTTSHLDKIGCIPVPKSTAHRWVAQSQCDEIDTGIDTMNLLFSDETGYKRRPNKDKNIDNRGKLQIAFGVEKTGRIRPLGSWSGSEWAAIAKKIQGNRKDDEPVAEMLVSDGQRDMIRGLERLCNFKQRCHWHASREVNYTMWKDEAPLDERKKTQHELANIIRIELPQEDVEMVADEDKQKLLDDVDEAEKKIDNLHRDLIRKGYTTAAKYIGRLRRQLFEYVHRWIETGLVSPRAASWIERVMREIARRLKRMAFGWSEGGAAKMAGIILKRFTNQKQWDEFWKKKLRLDGNVIVMLRSIKAIHPPNVGR